jgi:thiol-disulfide isomerase/thioredoxin
MTVPFFVTSALGFIDIRRHALSTAGKIGLALALLSLCLVFSPAHDGITRWKQSRNQALHGVAAPLFDSVDLLGQNRRLADQKGKVVLVSIWATWCGPCRVEMPKLDQLYRQRRDRGFVVFGLSSEDPGVQRKFLEKVSVSYPVLTVGPGIPDFYRDIARYPAVFLIDREGNLQPAPNPELPFEETQTAVDALLNNPPKTPN